MPNIEVTATSNVSGGVQGLQKLQAELGKTAIATQKTDSSLAKLGTGFQSVGAKSQIASTALSSIGGAAGGAVSGIASLGSAMLSGGILIAIPLIVSGLAVLGQAMFGLTKEQKQLTDVLSGAKDAYVKATIEVEKLSVAFVQARNGVITKEEALKLYNSTIGKTIGQTDSLAEAELNFIKNADAYIKFTLLKAAANIALGKAAEAAFKAEVERQQGPRKATFLESLGRNRTRGGAGGLSDEQLQQKRINEAIKEEISFRNIANELQKQAIALGFDYNAVTEDTVKKVKAVKEIKIKPKKIKVEADRDTEFSIPPHTEIPDVKEPLKIRMRLDPVIEFNNQKALDDMRKAIEEFRAQVADIATGALSNIFSGLADVVSGKGGIGDMFKGIAHFLGSNIKKLGQQVLQIAILAKLAKTAIKNPFTGIIAGIALIALGTAIEAATSKNAFASGGTVMIGGRKLVGERGPELLDLPTGTKVTPNNELNAFGGGGANSFVAEFRMSYADLVIAVRRGEATLGRNN